MPIRIINDHTEFEEAINNYDKDIKNFVLIEIINKLFSFTLEYVNGKLTSSESKQVNVDKTFNLVSHGLPIEIPYTETPVLIFGFVIQTPEGLKAFVTDFSMPESKVAFYTDRLNVLHLWGFQIASYLEIDRKKILTDISKVNYCKHINKQLLIIPNKQTNLEVNNWPLMIK